MAAILLKGKVIADGLKVELDKEISLLIKKPCIGSVVIGEDKSCLSYIDSQKKTANSLGVDYRLFKIPESAKEKEVIELVKKLNKDVDIDGVIVQLPIPKHIDRFKILEAVSVDKDVEGMHPDNLGKIILGEIRVIPCTANAVMRLIESTGVKVYGKEAVIIGHSDIVGKPLSMLLLNKLATTCVCHVATYESGNLAGHIKRADILVVAVGKPAFIKGDWIKEGAIVIDVGINIVDNKIVGDVDFPLASERASFITPVPGGVGPLTTMMLMKNLVNLIKTR